MFFLCAPLDLAPIVARYLRDIKIGAGIPFIALRTRATEKLVSQWNSHPAGTTRGNRFVQKMATLKSKVIQYMLSHGCVTADELFAFLQPMRPEGSSQLSEDNTARSIANLNEKLQMFNMMIRSVYDSKTRQRYYSLISTVDNEIMRQASHHTEKEFEYFRLIWRELQSGSNADLHDLQQIGKNLKLANYKSLITKWCEKRWLHVDGDEVTLGPRANTELDVLLINNTSNTSEHDASTSA